ncbi:MAG: non-canonical purine NTP pyrophosphatase [Thermoplasmata archaeon]
MVKSRDRLTFVSTNPGKAREVREILAPYEIDVRWKRRLLPEPQAADLETVARSKLAAVGDLHGYVLVEDSGLFIDSLAGFPGVYSAHFLTAWGFGPMLELLRHRSRRARFRAVAGLRLGSRTWTFPGEVEGKIAPRARGAHGFGYDPIFIPLGEKHTFGELPVETKNRRSHRYQAIRGVGEFIQRRRTRRR